MDEKQTKTARNLSENREKSPENQKLTQNASVTSPEAREGLASDGVPYDGSITPKPQGTSLGALGDMPTSKPYDKKWHILLVVVLGAIVLATIGVILVVSLKNQETTDDQVEQNTGNSSSLTEGVDEDDSADESTSILDIVGRDLTKEEALARECAVHPDFSGGFAASHWDAENQIFTSSMADPEYVWVSCDWGLALKVVPNMTMRGKVITDGDNTYAYFNGITTDTEYYTQYQGKLPPFYQEFIDNDDNFGLVGVSRMLKQDFDEVIASGGVMGSVALLLELVNRHPCIKLMAKARC